MRQPESPQWLERINDYARMLSAGDLTALGSLFDLVGPRLVRYAQAILRSGPDAEDAVQAAVIRLASHPENLANSHTPWAYCLRVVRNESLRLMSKHKPTAMLPSRDLTAPHRRWSVEDEETRQQVLAAIQRLPQDQGEVVVLKVWENLTFAEIAEVTGDSLNTVASRYRYALEKLQRSLGSLAEEAGHAQTRR